MMTAKSFEKQDGGHLSFLLQICNVLFFCSNFILHLVNLQSSQYKMQETQS